MYYLDLDHHRNGFMQFLSFTKKSSKKQSRLDSCQFENTFYWQEFQTRNPQRKYQRTFEYDMKKGNVWM